MNKPVETPKARPSEIREAIIWTVIAPFGWLRAGEPFFRVVHKLPQRLRDKFSQLKSDDIKNDNWHLR